MPLNKSSVKSALIITAATIGSGVFALPYVIAQAGWLLTLLYFAVLGTMVVTAHAVYLRTLAGEGEKQRLLGLARKYFGEGGFWFGFVGIVVGLLLSFVIFLILGTQFLTLLFPSLPHLAALLLFWLLLAVPAFLGNRRTASLEGVSVACVAAIIIFVFASSRPAVAFAAIPAINWHNLFLPFSVVLFTLAGWTGVEPFYESSRQGQAPRRGLVPKLALGTAFAVLLYWLFAAGILSSAPHLTPDTVSGLAGWPTWKLDLVAVFGLFALSTVAMPISHEIRNALEKDLHWPRILSRLAIVALPLAAVLAGFTNLLTVIGLAGGLFVGMEYVLIVAVARRALALPAAQKLLLDLVAVIFLAAAVYEIIKLF
jgi:amino acid permease